MDFSRAFNMAAGFWGAIISLFLFGCLLTFYFADKIGKVYYREYMLVALLNVFSLGCDACAGNAGYAASETLRTVLCMLRPASMCADIVLLVYLSLLMARRLLKGKKLRYWKWFLAAAATVQFALVLSSCTNGWLYTIDDFGISFSSLFWLTLLPSSAIIIGSLTLSLFFRAEDPIFVRAGWWVTFLMLGAAGLTQQWVSSFPILHIAQVIAVFLRFCGMQRFMVALAVKQKEQLEEQRSRMLAAELQPHVLYNSLTAIMGIEGNPPETKHAIANFARYLRGNLNMLEKDEPILIEDELTHVQQYLELEKLRFGDRLEFRTDFQAGRFFVPPLSVEMLVENAIRHGALVGNRSGTVKLSTFTRGTDYVVAVEDNGPGFDTSILQKENPGHVGLKNISERVKRMCGGSVHIESEPGKGTVAELTIPQMGVME